MPKGSIICAIQINPGYATAHQWLSVDHYAMLGRLDDALTTIEAAVQLDPLSSIIREGRAFVLMLRGDFEGSIRRYREILGFDPSFYKAYTSMGRVYLQMGQPQQALAMLHEGRKLAGDMPNILSAMGQAYALSGDRERANELLCQLQREAQTKYVPAVCFAIIHIGLGELEKALDHLEEGCDRREPQLPALRVHPLYDPLREEPRFQALLRRLRLA